MASREQILAAIRGLKLEESPLPEPFPSPGEVASPIEKFRGVLQAIGAETEIIGPQSRLSESLRQRCEALRITRLCSVEPTLVRADLGREALILDDVQRPHDLENLEAAIVRGELAVAEDAAVWVGAEAFRHRAVLFLPRHLFLVVREVDIVWDLHQAYERLAGQISKGGYFISGPSKTADIEQNLVIGAQGPKSLCVFIEQ